MALKKGDLAPDLELKDQTGKTINFRTLEQPFVVYFYPKDFTPGCTKEACGFRDYYEDFKDFGAEVFGISTDSADTHSRFKEKYRLPFTLLSDADKKAQKAFGVTSYLLGLIPGRETFVFDKNGKLLHKFNSLNAGKHVKEALGSLKNDLQKKGK